MTISIKSILRNDLWKSIEAHYEKADYTEAVRDAMFFINEIVREKSGIIGRDGTALMEAAFLGKNAALKISKCETQTEKDIQEGTGYALKGLCLSIRNPLSHENIIVGQNDANAIILYTNYLANIVDKSKGKTKIDDWMNFILDPYFTNTEKYANELLKEIPVRKRFDLLLQIFKNRIKFEQNKINAFTHVLLNSITTEEHKEFVEIINKDLLRCIDDKSLRMFIHIFTPELYEYIEPLCKMRIENLIKNSINNGEFGIWEDVSGYGNYEQKDECNGEGLLATWISKKVDMLDIREELIELLQVKLGKSDTEKNYVMNYFSDEIFNSDIELSYYGKNVIHKLLKENDKDVIESMSFLIEAIEDKKWIDEFWEDYISAKTFIENPINSNYSINDDIPF